MTLLPTRSEERWLALSRRLGRSPLNAPFPAHSGAWRTAGLLSRIAYFVLGLIAAAMLSEIAGIIFNWQVALLLAGILCVITAEWLIIARRHFASGIEESLEAAGLGMVACKCWDLIGSTSPTAGGICIGIALGIAGMRLLNPVLTTLAVLALVVAVDAPPLGAAFVCYAIGVTALLGGAHYFRRPSHDFMLDALVVVMPAAGYFWSAYKEQPWTQSDYFHSVVPWIVPAAPLLYAALSIITGLRRRSHAPLVASMLCSGAVAYELRRFTGLSVETRLILGGCALVLIAMVLERVLKVPRQGITSRALRGEADASAILGMASIAALTPNSAPAKDSSSFHGGGGGFSGGGAEGKF